MSLSGVSYEVEAETVETEIRGFITASLEADPVGELSFVDYDGVTQITRIFVDSEYQRQGIATGMLEELRAYLPASVPAQYFMNGDARALHAAVIERFKDPTV